MKKCDVLFIIVIVTAAEILNEQQIRNFSHNAYAIRLTLSYSNQADRGRDLCSMNMFISWDRCACAFACCGVQFLGSV